MPPRERRRLVTWYLLAKEEWLPAQWERVKEWTSVVRAEPALVWETPAVRYTAFALAVLLGVWLLVWAVSLLEPPGAAEMQAGNSTVGFHVVCSNRECGRHFMITREEDFDDFPVQCPFCKQKTGQHAMRCLSPTCQGTYVIPIEVDGELRCSECGAVLGKAP